MAQVRNLRPGRRYAYRIVIKPDVVPPWADPPEQPPSAAEIYETPATVPMPPKPIKCTRRERAAFEVCTPLYPRPFMLLGTVIHAVQYRSPHAGRRRARELRFDFNCSCGGLSQERQGAGQFRSTQLRCGRILQMPLASTPTQRSESLRCD